MLASFRSQTKCPFLSVIQLSSFSDHLKRRPPHWEVQDQRVLPFPPFFSIWLSLLSAPHCLVFRLQSSTILRDMCVVFAGPFPAGFSQREVRRLFRSCGPVHEIRMLHTAVRVCLTFSASPDSPGFFFSHCLLFRNVHPYGCFSNHFRSSASCRDPV